MIKYIKRWMTSPKSHKISSELTLSMLDILITNHICDLELWIIDTPYGNYTKESVLPENVGKALYRYAHFKVHNFKVLELENDEVKLLVHIERN